MSKQKQPQLIKVGVERMWRRQPDNEPQYRINRMFRAGEIELTKPNEKRRLFVGDTLNQDELNLLCAVPTLEVTVTGFEH